MLVSIKALIVVLLIGWVCFRLLEPIMAEVQDPEEFASWKKIWYLMIIAGFLAPNFWVLVLLIILVIRNSMPTDQRQRPLYYILLLCVLPITFSEIPGFGGIRFIIRLDYPMLLAVLLLASIHQMSKTAVPMYGMKSDKYIMLFILFNSLLVFRDDSVTNALRQVVYIVLGVYLPYFVISRNLLDKEQFKRLFCIILIVALPLSVIACFESAKHWLLFNALPVAQQGFAQTPNYLARGGSLRATGVFSSPIGLGYFLVIAIGAWLYLRQATTQKKRISLIGIILFIGLIATFSRGPWLGLAVLWVVFIWSGRAAIKHYLKAAFLATLLLPVVMITPQGEKIINLLPGVADDTESAGSVDYRQKLIEQSWLVFQKKPLFGDRHYRDSPEMQVMQQGQGIIDVVNSYIHIALSTGLIGLFLFCTIFIGLLLALYKQTKLLRESQPDLALMARVLLAVLSAMLFIIATVSSVGHIPYIYWAFSGVAAGFIYMDKERSSASNVKI